MSLFFLPWTCKSNLLKVPCGVFVDKQKLCWNLVAHQNKMCFLYCTVVLYYVCVNIGSEGISDFKK